MGDHGHSSQKSGFCNFLYDPDTKLVMGRSGKQWCQLLVFYVIFYAGVVGFWIACLFGFLATTNEKMPTLTGYQSMLKLNPAIGYLPQPDYESNLIKFNGKDPKTFNVTTDLMDSYLADANKFLAQYFNATHLNLLTNCTNGRNASVAAGCRFNPLEEANEHGCFKELAPPFSLGFNDSTPCVLLKMNRIIGWLPRSRPDGGYHDVKVRCVGENEADNETIGIINYSPGGVDIQGPYGKIEAKYFPYMNQPYLSPFVAARFSQIRPFTVALIWCQFDSEEMDFAPETYWASRVLTERSGGAHFELVVDSEQQSNISPSTTLEPTRSKSNMTASA